MGFGVKWSTGNKHEFEVIDFGYNTAGDEVLAKLAASLETWDSGSDLMKLQAETVFHDLYARTDPKKGFQVPDRLRELRASCGDLSAKFNKVIEDQLYAIKDSWFNQNGPSQWVFDARLRPVEVEAVMARAKLELCRILLDKQASKSRWMGQCEWPEFFVQVSVNEATDTAELWVFGPDNATPRDMSRSTDDPGKPSNKMEGTRGLSGEVRCHDFVGRVPTIEQEGVYLAEGEVRTITELRWRPGADAAPLARRRLLGLPGPIAEDDAAALAELDKVQGNILKSHGRPQAVHLLLRFNDGAQARRYLRGLKVTSAAAQRGDAAKQAAPDRPLPHEEPPFIGFGLSAKGYAALNEALGKGGPPLLPVPSDAVFRQGMGATGRLTQDPPVDQWQDPYQGHIHAIVTLAHGYQEQLDALVRAERERCAAAAVTIVAEERGFVQRNGRGQSVEPFGFADGINQPRFFAADVAKQLGVDADGQPLVDGAFGWEQGFAPSQVLVDDDNGYGGYLVFRKLEQDVRRFREVTRALAGHLDQHPDEAGEQLIGRRADGSTPLVDPTGTLLEAGEAEAAAVGDHGYGQASGCPVGAHVRRVNDRSHRARDMVMARRGMRYDERDQVLAEEPSEGVGLLFMACVWDLLHQFVDVQAEAVRPIEGSPDPLLAAGGCWWSDPRGARRSVDLGEGPLVRMLGGEYFYLPPPAFLSALPE